MKRNKGSFFWESIVNKFEGKDMSDEDWKFCDSLEGKVKTDADKRILEFFSILITNYEQKERYFRHEMMTYVDEIYKGHTDSEALQAMK